MHVQIKPGLRRVWRGTGTLQIGLSRRRGTVLSGLTVRDLPLVERLREGVRPNTADVGRGTAGLRGRELLRLLDEAGVLTRRSSGPPAPDSPVARLVPDAMVWSLVHPGRGDGWELLADRGSRSVLVRGGGRLGTTLAAVLTGAGVGHVRVEDDGRVGPGDPVAGGATLADVGRPRPEAAHDAMNRAGSLPVSSAVPLRERVPREMSAGGRSAGVREATAVAEAPGPDLVVLIEHGAADAGRADPLMSTDVVHLSVVVREDDVVVGPLVRPGDGPCLRCLDLHRGDRDPDWPSVLTQVLNPTADVARPEETAASTLAAGLAALQVLAHLDGVPHPAAVGATLEVELPDGLVARRPWPAHPRCGCLWPPRPESGDPAGERSGRGTRRMGP